MTPATRTPEGDAQECPVCGTVIAIEPSQPLGDAPCPSCGVLLWFLEGRHTPVTADAAKELADKGVYITTEADGEVTDVRFVGFAYDNSTLSYIARIEGVRTVDIRATVISVAGAERLRELMPGVEIISD